MVVHTISYDYSSDTGCQFSQPLVTLETKVEGVLKGIEDFENGA